MSMEEQGSSSAGGDDGIERMMKQLGLREEDLDAVVFEAEDPPPEEATRWMIIARVHTESEYSIYWFFKNMKTAWDLARDAKTKTLESNLHIFQFACLGDWEKVTEGGPWAFRGNSVLMAPYDGFSKPSSIKLNHIDIWIQIHDLPIGYAPMVKALASKVGEFKTSESNSFGFEGNFYRVKVRLDVRNPLKSVVSISRGGKRELFSVKYDKLPNWCQVCGHLGHEYKEHGDGIHPPSALVFKNMRASWRSREGGSRPGRGSRGGRGGSVSGRGSSLLSQNFTADDTEEVEEVDMDSDDLEKNRNRDAPSSGIPGASGNSGVSDGKWDQWLINSRHL
ncbi:hypothetical protein QYE76_068703 [Lolium multiflorum]|uniref:DUF4283 domain-containing protein n=1 Tax=Lolium multiflorum TaxID=4521 RepID=A0AAD8WC72_LOLMU|nr:hypothetical protein QYE76_068703 [Lolium multiflorum]